MQTVTVEYVIQPLWDSYALGYDYGVAIGRQLVAVACTAQQIRSDHGIAFDYRTTLN